MPRSAFTPMLLDELSPACAADRAAGDRVPASAGR
jgi:hypothetical protein